MSFSQVENNICELPTEIPGVTCVIATAALNAQIEEELKIEDPTQEMAEAAILYNSVNDGEKN